MRLQSLKVLALLVLGLMPGELEAQEEIVVPALGIGAIFDHGSWASLGGNLGLRYERNLARGWWGGIRFGGRGIGATCDDAGGPCGTFAWEIVAATRHPLRKGTLEPYVGAELGVGTFPPTYTLVGVRLGTDFGGSKALRVEVRAERLLGVGLWSFPLEIGLRIRPGSE